MTPSIKVIDNYKTHCFIQSIIRFKCEVGYPKYILIDESSQLVNGYDAMRLSLKNIKNKLYQDVMVDFDVCPVGGYNFNGKAERRNRHIKEPFEKCIQNKELSNLQWEALASELAKTINDLYPSRLKILLVTLKKYQVNFV